MFDPNLVKIGIVPISWSNDDLQELGADTSFEQCVDEIAEAGYAGCEMNHKFPRDPDVLKNELTKRNLSLASAWFSTYFTEEGREQETIDGFITHMNFLKTVGAKVIVVCECGHCIQGDDKPVFSEKPIFTDKQWARLFSGLEELGRIARENDMEIVFHHHMGTGVQNQNEVDMLMEGTDPELVSLLVDTGHMTFSGGDPLQLIKDHGKRVKHVHLKDIRASILEEVKIQNKSFLDGVLMGVFTVPGDGVIKYEPIFQELSNLNYSGWLIVEAEQDPEKANPLQYAKMARTFIREKIKL